MKDELKAYGQKIKEWWIPLKPREKQMVSVGGVVVTLALLYVLIWSPILNHLDVMRKRIVSDGKALQWMQGANAKINQLLAETKGQQQVQSPVALLAILQKQVTEHGLAQSLSELKQASNDSIDLQFKQVDFDHFVGFLIVVLKENHIAVSALSAKVLDKPGMTDITLTLKI